MPPALVRTDLLGSPELKGRAFVEAYTDRVEQWLAAIFAEEAGEAAAVSLVALGGQGRRELAPQSDLDLLLLHEGRDAPSALAEALWYPIWDEGLKLGHSVRTVRDTLSLASGDLETATALLSARHICGDEELTLRLRERARANWVKRGRRWADELSADVRKRHEDAGDVAYALEPDLKEGRGGMRDVHALGWVSAAGEPVDERLLAGLVEPYDELLAVRVELHRIQGQPGDALVLQEQDTVAAALGLADADALMERVSGAGRRIAEVSDEAWYDLDTRHGARGSLLRRRDRSLGDGLVSRQGRVALVDELRPPADPFACLEVALAAAREGQRISRATLNSLVGAPSPPGGPQAWPDEARQRFVELLLLGHPSVEVIQVLAGRGLWVRLLPEWRRAESRPQRNAYHRFTVDRHLLECAANAAELSSRVSRPDLLVMAALLHDIGKAYPELGDHSEQGAPMAGSICRRMGFAEPDVETIETLVRHHLLLADVATRRDLSDPATAEHVAGVLGTAERVELLQVLTEADSLATGPSAWSPWKSDLVQRLAWGAIEALGGSAGERRGEASTGSEVPGRPADCAPATPEKHRHLLEGQGVCTEAVADTLVVAYDRRHDGFARIAGVLALNGLDVLGASVHTEGGRELAEFTVDTGVSACPHWERVSADVEAALNGRLALRSRLAERSRSTRRPHVVEHQFEPAVRFDNGSTTSTTVVEVVGPDSTGLLYRLARALGDFDLGVTAARIHTMGADVVDSFYVEPPGGGLLVDEGLQAEIRRALLDELDPGTARQLT